MRVGILAVALLLFASVASAQTADQPTLYLHRAAESGPYFFNTNVEDGAYDSSGYNVLGLGLSCEDGGYCWTGSAEPAPAADLELDANQPVVVSVTIKTIVSVFGVGTVGDGPGFGNLEVDLTVGGQSWGSFEESMHEFSGDFETFTWEALPPADVLAAGSQITLDVRLFAASGGAVIGMNPTDGHTTITFPVPSGEVVEIPVIPDGPIFGEPLEGMGTVAIDMPDVTSQNHFTNWTQPLTAFDFNFTSSGQGNLTFTLLDEDNTTVHQDILAAGQTTSGQLVDVEPGAWTILVDFTNFNGTVHATFAAPEEEDEGGEPSSTPTSGSEPPAETQDETNAPEGDDESSEPVEESPGPAVLSLVALIGAIAYLRRR